jgi:hypothetical protein
VGSDEVATIESEWAELRSSWRHTRDAGTDPSDPEVRALAERWRDLTERTAPAAAPAKSDLINEPAMNANTSHTAPEFASVDHPPGRR